MGIKIAVLFNENTKAPQCFEHVKEWFLSADNKMLHVKYLNMHYVIPTSGVYLIEVSNEE